MLERGEFAEKRDFIRMGVNCPATFTINDDAATYQGIADNLSATGLQVTTDKMVNEGVFMEINVQPEQAVVAPLKAHVEVVRTTPVDGGKYVLGLRVIEMHPLD